MLTAFAATDIRIDTPPRHVWNGETLAIRGAARSAEGNGRVAVEAILSMGNDVLVRAGRTVDAAAKSWTPFSFDLSVPGAKRRTDVTLTIVGGDTPNVYPLVVFPRGKQRDMKKLTEWKRIGIVDPDGTLGRHLESRDAAFRRLPTRLAMRAFRGDIVIVNARDLGGKRDSLLELFRDNAADGLSVLFLDPDTIPVNFRDGLGVGETVCDSIVLADTLHPITQGLELRHLAGWRPDGNVADAGVTTPLEGNFSIDAFAGGPADTVLILEIPMGRGRYVFSAFHTGLDENGDPAALSVLDNLILHVLNLPDRRWRSMAVMVDTGTEEVREVWAGFGEFGDTGPDMGDTYPLWLIEAKGEYLNSFLRGRPTFWREFFARIETGGETAIFLNVDEEGWDILSKYIPDVELKVVESKASDTFHLPKAGKSFLNGLRPEDIQAYALLNPKAVRYALEVKKWPDKGWGTAPAWFAFIPYKKGGIYFVQLDLPQGLDQPTRRFWMRLLTAWGVEVKPGNPVAE